uniref:N-ethylmaleimide-sensitive factor attachment protein, beta b n=2 Tax=Sparus aurata TaxID=8175 RepID=A0A671VMW5_SPAAU
MLLCFLKCLCTFQNVVCCYMLLYFDTLEPPYKHTYIHTYNSNQHFRKPLFSPPDGSTAPRMTFLSLRRRSAAASPQHQHQQRRLPPRLLSLSLSLLLSPLLSSPLRPLRNIGPLVLLASLPAQRQTQLAMDNSGKEKEAMQLMAEADKKVKASGSFLGGMFGGNHKVEDACEMYARAANMFKMAKNWSAAGNAFCQAARLHMQLQNKLDSATSFVDAGNAYKKADPQEAINCLNQAIDIYTDMGRFTIAAKHHITIAEVYESELVDIEKAIAHYEQAADYYKGEESNSSANKCLLKVGHYSAQLEQYPKAIEIYEQVAMSTMDNPLLKYNAKEYFFKASLCHFIVDELNAKLAIEKYEEMFPAFSDSRELKLLKKLLEAHEEQNSEAFTEAVKDFDSVSRLDQWLTTMLLRIKKTIQGDAGDLK